MLGSDRNYLVGAKQRVSLFSALLTVILCRYPSVNSASDSPVELCN